MTTRTLDAAVYWKLRWIFSETQRALVSAAAARDSMTVAQQRQDAYLRELGLDPKAASWALDDDACTVTLPDAGPSPVIT